MKKTSVFPRGHYLCEMVGNAPRKKGKRIKKNKDIGEEKQDE